MSYEAFMLMTKAYWVTWRLGAQISLRETTNLSKDLSVPPSPYLSQRGTIWYSARLEQIFNKI